jgi:polar amino acid transport system permease protein
VHAPSEAQKPYWLAAVLLAFLLFAVLLVNDGRYWLIFTTLLQGIGVTVLVAVLAFAIAATLGLLIAMAQLSKHAWLNQPARLYTEVLRGLPTLVILLYVTFAGAPMVVEAYQWLFEAAIAQGEMPDWQLRDFSNLARGVIALAMAYSAFLAEIFRAGIQCVPREQIEAAKVLGLNRVQTFRLVVWPQALRNILPALGNDFIAIVKDSSLVSVLGVNDITQLGKLHASSSFLTVETYNVVAVLYLMLTISLSLLLRRLEKHLRKAQHAQ